MRNTADVTGGKPIAVLLQSISGVSAINPFVALYDIHGGEREVLFFYFVPDTTRRKRKFKFYIINFKIPSRLHRYNKCTVFRVPVFSTNYRRNSFLIRALEATNEVWCDIDIFHDSLSIIRETLLRSLIA
jgi:hypothetical protein